MADSPTGCNKTFARPRTSTTKAAMRSFVRSWAADFKDRGIRVNILSPGPIDTPIIEGQFKTKEEAKGMNSVRFPTASGEMSSARYQAHWAASQ